MSKLARNLSDKTGVVVDHLAQQGDAGAQFNLGFKYDNGRGVEEDNSDAAAWYRNWAEQCDAGAQNNLCFMYSNGRGVEEDHSKAVLRLVSAVWLRAGRTSTRGSP